MNNCKNWKVSKVEKDQREQNEIQVQVKVRWREEGMRIKWECEQNVQLTFSAVFDDNDDSGG